jgi:hypothetical protein
VHPAQAVIEDHGSGRYHVFLPANLGGEYTYTGIGGRPYENAGGTVNWDQSHHDLRGNGPSSSRLIRPELRTRLRKLARNHQPGANLKTRQMDLFLDQRP